MQVVVHPLSSQERLSCAKSNLPSSASTNEFSESAVIKSKGVDIALAVRAIDDAHRNLFHVCALFVSDIDYLPLIETLRSIGKAVYVFGYGEGIAKESPFMYAPDRFIDIGEEFMRKHYRQISTSIDINEV